MNTQANADKFLARSSLFMKIVGWGFLPLTLPILYLYPKGFLWGIHQGTQWSPYLFMMMMLYLAWFYLLIRESKNPQNAVLLFDWGIIANSLHALVMLFQAFYLEHEMAHLWGDVSGLLILVFALWYFSPRRIQTSNN